MSDGDSLDHIWKVGSIETTDNSSQVLLSAPIPVGTDGVVAIEAWAHGTRVDTSLTRYLEHRIGMGTIDAGDFVLDDEGPLGTALDVGASGYVVGLSESADAVQLLVTGATGHTVRWHGELKIRITEAALDTDFG